MTSISSPWQGGCHLGYHTTHRRRWQRNEIYVTRLSLEPSNALCHSLPAPPVSYCTLFVCYILVCCEDTYVFRVYCVISAQRPADLDNVSPHGCVVRPGVVCFEGCNKALGQTAARLQPSFSNLHWEFGLNRHEQSEGFAPLLFACVAQHTPIPRCCS